jgi:hypothetical protein
MKPRIGNEDESIISMKSGRLSASRMAREKR